METRILCIDADNPQPELLEQAAEILWRGGVIAAPTDTVYGLLADPANQAAVQHIYEVKGRDFRRPLILLVADVATVERLCPQVPPLARQAMTRFWPGGLTIILEKGPAIPDHLTAGGETIGLRLPAHAVALGLIRAAGFPLASTSANRSGEPAATSAQPIETALQGEIDLIIDSGPTPLGVESSVVDFTPAIRGSPPRLLREGGLPRQTLEKVLGEIL